MLEVAAVEAALVWQLAEDLGALVQGRPCPSWDHPSCLLASWSHPYPSLAHPSCQAFPLDLPSLASLVHHPVLVLEDRPFLCQGNPFVVVASWAYLLDEASYPFRVHHTSGVACRPLACHPCR